MHLRAAPHPESAPPYRSAAPRSPSSPPTWASPRPLVVSQLSVARATALRLAAAACEPAHQPQSAHTAQHRAYMPAPRPHDPPSRPSPTSSRHPSSRTPSTTHQRDHRGRHAHHDDDDDDRIGPYAIAEEIGRGSFATVYRGERQVRARLLGALADWTAVDGSSEALERSLAIATRPAHAADVAASPSSSRTRAAPSRSSRSSGAS